MKVVWDQDEIVIEDKSEKNSRGLINIRKKKVIVLNILMKEFYYAIFYEKY